MPLMKLTLFKTKWKLKRLDFDEWLHKLCQRYWGSCRCGRDIPVRAGLLIPPCTEWRRGNRDRTSEKGAWGLAWGQAAGCRGQAAGCRGQGEDKPMHPEASWTPPKFFRGSWEPNEVCTLLLWDCFLKYEDACLFQASLFFSSHAQWVRPYPTWAGNLTAIKLSSCSRETFTVSSVDNHCSPVPDSVLCVCVSQTNVSKLFCEKTCRGEMACARYQSQFFSGEFE